ncbi:MAG: hypothetical protein RL410_1576, partial [Actinomycetota bacterium]
MIIPAWLQLATFSAFVLVLLLDFVFVERRPHDFSTREATLWVGIYVSLALIFTGVLLVEFNGEIAQQFFSAYLTEYSLSIDNLFVFMVVMSTFAVPKVAQHRVLMFGILFALALRALLIVLGVQLIRTFEASFIVFGLFLLWTAWKVATSEEDEEPQHIKDHILVKMASKLFPTHPEYSGSRITVVLDKKRYLTPIALVMLVIGATDLLFALDSIPAVLGLTTETFIVLTSNAFALMGLRQLYFLLNGLLDRLVHLARGLSLILAFIGVKLMLEGADQGFGVHVVDIPTSVSLLVIAAVLAVTTVTSLIATRHEQSVIQDTV